MIDSSIGGLFTTKSSFPVRLYSSSSKQKQKISRISRLLSRLMKGSSVMLGNQKLLIIWVWMMLLASLCPCSHGKRGFGGRGMSKGAASVKAPPSQSKGSSSKQGLKLAGAAAAGAIGGAAIGYGLGSLGKPRYGHGGYSDGYYQAGRHNQSEWRHYANTGSSEHVGSLLVTLATVAHVIIMWA